MVKASRFRVGFHLGDPRLVYAQARDPGMAIMIIGTS